MRALEPHHHGQTVRGGVELSWELFGAGEHTVFLLPSWSIIHSRHWKLQVPALARRHRVLVMDGRGNGRSGRPLAPEMYADEEFAADALAVMDATGTDAAHLVSLSAGARWALLLAAEQQERVRSATFLAPGLPLAPGNPGRVAAMLAFEEPRDSYDGWFKYNANFWLKDHRGFLEFFFSKVFCEPHSMKPIEDTITWGLETTPEVLVATARAPALDEARTMKLVSQVSCPVFVIHGDEDQVMPHARGAELAAATGDRLLTLEGSGHCPHVRDPIAVNQALLDFLPGRQSRGSRRRALRRPRRALIVSSPIGLGHARRDIAIARELRALVPDLEIDWLAQHPVTAVLAEHGERVHPASRHLASESRHIELEADEHRLAVFEAFRRMDEILVANFGVFHEVVTAEDYDLWIGD
jgi:pimeloyl-ACP methyl ester carboxylesterase